MKYFKHIAKICLPLLSVGLVACVAPPTDQQAIETLCMSPSTAFEGHSQRALLGAGYKAMAADRLECAEKLLTQAQKLDAQDPYATLNLGVLYHRTARLAQARAAYERTMQLDQVQPAQLKENAEVSMDQNRSAKLSAGEIARRNLALIP